MAIEPRTLPSTPSRPGRLVPRPDEPLPCGRTIGESWEEPPDRHTERCPYCLRARAALAEVHRAAEALTARPVVLRPELTHRILAAVRQQIRRGRLLPVPSRSPAYIWEAAAAASLRRAVDTATDALVASCRLAPGPRGDVTIALTLRAAYGRPLAEQAEKVRHVVLATATRTLGLTVHAVDLYITDVLPVPP
ncbi:hypothetical protein AB0442_27260 [Kitasatospora sp. NPDC085895]|uniref:hypothetical protein n=1 Tax=Kitasatospora sp. NPDC085895 TaxID=3155057 RepID=UPI00344CB1BA